LNLDILLIRYIIPGIFGHTTGEKAVVTTMQAYYSGTRICWGDAGQWMQQLRPERLMVVSDPYFAQSGLAQTLAEQSGAKNVEIFSQVAPDPSVELAARAAAAAKAFGPDAIVALGGGSAMDLAKAMKYFSGSQATLVAVPTTSGSGSEVTSFAILTHQGIKHPLVDDSLTPQMAIIDPALVVKLPPALIADGGFDVLTHALEAFTATNASPITDTLSRESFGMTLVELGRSFEGDLSARERVHSASTLAGLSFTQAGLGLCHGLAHALGGEFHVPHGRLNAILLPAVMRHNLPAAVGKYAILARAAGIEGRSDAMAVRALVNRLGRLRRELGLPENLAQAGVSPRQLQDKLESIAQAAAQDPCCATNPCPVTIAGAKRVLLEVAGG
jgi:alcohol dehydrogenase class IV